MADGRARGRRRARLGGADRLGRPTAVEKVCIWTPDKDLAQCVRGDRVVQVDRRSQKIRNADGSAREVRGGARADSRFSRARRRQRGRLSGHPRDWAGHRGAAAQSIRRHRRLSRRRCSASAATRRCSSRSSRRCGPTRRSSTTSTSFAGAAPLRRSPRWWSASETRRLLERCRAGASVGGAPRTESRL